MKILCLANSFRLGGRCVGGIELNHENAPIVQNGRPKWVRPVCNTEQEQVPTNLVSSVKLLDIIEFNAIENTGHGHQTENVLFDTRTIRTAGRLDIASLEGLIDNNRFNTIFGNRGAAVPGDKVDTLGYSLSLLKLRDFETNEREFEGREYPQIKLSFKYNGATYNLPITDPAFHYQYNRNKTILNGRNNIYVTISLAASHDGWSSKLVAGIVIGENMTVETEDFDLSDFF